jgi:hypothetical protein
MFLNILIASIDAFTFIPVYYRKPGKSQAELVYSKWIQIVLETLMDTPVPWKPSAFTAAVN